MDHICTWLCADEKGQESLFPQTGKLSSSQSHQDIYWRCILVFFITSRRFNKTQKHVLFTNVKKLPVVDGRKISSLLNELDVEVVFTDFKYRTPKGYYKAFQNQFYEFSILEHISMADPDGSDHYLILDSDCIFVKPVDQLFNAARPAGFISFEDQVLPDYVINGLSRNDLKEVYEELMGKKLNEIPTYHLGEFFLASVKNIRKIYADFTELWPILLERHEKGLKKFNEEAHTLSYLYFKNELKAGRPDSFMKRIWTNPLFYRNVSASDTSLAIWHLPAEKTFGLYRLYDYFMNECSGFGLDMSHEKYTGLVQRTLGVPNLTLRMRLKYYSLSYYRAIRKRISQKAASL
ncbi:MAG TPA: hypothetical protein VFR58_11635 [Flavisolibacter sp.]|nr:hypothetical protein [Flavisolibacter sp.]